MGDVVLNPMRSLPTSRCMVCAYGSSGLASSNGSPGSEPCSTSSARALSRQLREITPSLEAPHQTSPKPGPEETRPREGRRPKSPQYDAGMRIEPPPSLPAAMGKHRWQLQRPSHDLHLRGRLPAERSRRGCSERHKDSHRAERQVRNRLTHPRWPEDLDVTPAETIAMARAVVGFKATLQEWRTG